MVCAEFICQTELISGIRFGCQKFFNLLFVVYFVLYSSVLMVQPHKSCTVGRAAEHHVKVTLGGHRIMSHRRELLEFPSEHEHPQLVCSRANHSTWILVAKPLPPHCGMVSGMNKLRGSAEG